MFSVFVVGNLSVLVFLQFSKASDTHPFVDEMHEGQPEVRQVET